jgi:DNA repair exonuclease SbcCD nuclease subunit
MDTLPKQRKVVKLPHNKVNLVFFTDCHLSAVPIGRRSDDYQAAVLGKIEFTANLTHKLKGAGLCGGDLFHYKNPRAAGNTMGLIEATARTLHKFPYNKVYGTIGNHDISYDNMSSLEHQPLGVLIAAGVYHNLVVDPVIFTNEDETVKVLVQTFPYCDEPDLLPLLLNSGPKPLGIDYRVALLHAYGHPDPSNATWGSSGIGYDPIGYDQVAHLEYDFMCWGHDHSRKETVTVGNVCHINFGSLARAAYNTDEVDRKVCVGVMSFEKDAVRFMEKEVPAKPLDVVFTTADKGMDRVSKSPELGDLFTDMDTVVDGIETSDPAEVLEQICPPDEPELLTLALDLCTLYRQKR